MMTAKMEGEAAGEQRRVGVLLLACACLTPDNPSLVWAPFRGRPLLVWSLETYAQTVPHASIMLVVEQEHLPAAQAICLALGAPHVMPIVVPPPARRRDATAAGLAALQTDDSNRAWVIVHEASRPLVTPRLILSVLGRATQENCATIASEPVKETLKRVAPGSDGQPDHVAETLPRESLARAQTPQVFPVAALAQALAALSAEANPPDEASLAALAGLPLLALPGDPRNLRATTQTDLSILESLANGNAG